jgi:hypothetical protein
MLAVVLARPLVGLRFLGFKGYEATEILSLQCGISLLRLTRTGAVACRSWE